jgi:hypothetical protein
VLQNDRNFFTVEFIIVTCIALHASLNVFMLSRLKRILRPKQVAVAKQEQACDYTEKWKAEEELDTVKCSVVPGVNSAKVP